MNEIKVVKIRPVSWRIHVQGKEEAEAVRTLLSNAGLEATLLAPEPTLTEPAPYAVLAAPRISETTTSEELEAILATDERVKLAFEEA
jgi:hypothetical protein